MPNPHDDAGGTFDRIAKAFDATRSRPWPFVADWIEDLDVAGRTVVDVGCGNCRHLTLVAERGMQGIGIDLSRELLSIARARLPPMAGVALGDARSLPLPDASAGAVLAVAVLHHIPTAEGRQTAALELARIAKRGAPVLVSVWALDDPDVANRARAMPVPGGGPSDLRVPWRDTEGPPVDRYCHMFDLGGLRSLLERAGLRVEAALDEGANHVLHARRPG